MYGASDCGGAPVRSTSPESSGLTVGGGGRRRRCVAVGGVGVGVGSESRVGTGRQRRLAPAGRRRRAGDCAPRCSCRRGVAATALLRSSPSCCSRGGQSRQDGAGPAAASPPARPAGSRAGSTKQTVFLTISGSFTDFGRPGDRWTARQRVPVRRPFVWGLRGHSRGAPAQSGPPPRTCYGAVTKATSRDGNTGRCNRSVTSVTDLRHRAQGAIGPALAAQALGSLAVAGQRPFPRLAGSGDRRCPARTASRTASWISGRQTT